MDLASRSAPANTASEDVDHVEPRCPRCHVLHTHSTRCHLLSANHTTPEQSTRNIHIPPLQRSNIPTSKHCPNHLGARNQGHILALTHRNRLNNWPKVAKDYDLPDFLLHTQYEKRIANHVLLENTVMDVVSLGMLIIDDVYPESGPPELGILGGAGTYATMGARLFYPEEASSQVGFVVHTGSDFSQETRDEIESWKSGSCFIDTPDRETTRGRNVYVNETRVFEFLTDKVQVNHANIPDHYVTAKVFHLICGPVRCVEVVKGILGRRAELVSIVPGLSEKVSAKPVFVWEPMEGCCEPRNRALIYEALKHVDVFSPNMQELSLLFQDQQDIQARPDDEQEPVGLGPAIAWNDALKILKSTIGQCIQLEVKGFDDPSKALVLRRGENGCTVRSHGHTSSNPAYHAPRYELTYTEKRLRKNKVIDVTGGGNAFLGGFCAGLAKGDKLCERSNFLFAVAAMSGTIAASFAIEQVGLPKLTPRKADGAERWNGSVPLERLCTLIENRNPAAFLSEVSEEETRIFPEWIRSVDIDIV